VSNVIQVPNNFTPRDYQLALFQAMDGIQGRPETKKRRALLRWHRRAGKDKACFCYMVKEMVQRVGVYYYFFPTYQQGRMAMWEAVDKDGFKLLDHLPDHFVARKSNQDMLLELTNGSIFRVVGTDNIDRIVGTNPVGCVFSEYSLQDPVAWTFISPILAENGGWAIFNGTPRGRNHMYKLEMAMSKRDSWFISALAVNDSGLEDLLREKISEDREIHGDDYVEQEYYVAYSAGVRGAIFMDHIEKARQSGRIGTYAYDYSKYVDTFWDLGVGDATSIWFRQTQGNQVVWIDYYEDTGKDLKFYVDILSEKSYNYRSHYLPHDGDSRNIIIDKTPREVLAHYCKEARISDDVITTRKFGRKTDAINATRARMPRMCWNEGTTSAGIEKLSLYHYRWDTKREVFLKEPVHDWTSHCADALMTEAAAEEFDDRDSPFHQSVPRVVVDFDLYDD